MAQDLVVGGETYEGVERVAATNTDGEVIVYPERNAIVADNAVLFDAQTLTDAQKAQARKNINALGCDDISFSYNAYQHNGTTECINTVTINVKKVVDGEETVDSVEIDTTSLYEHAKLHGYTGTLTEFYNSLAKNMQTLKGDGLELDPEENVLYITSGGTRIGTGVGLPNSGDGTLTNAVRYNQQALTDAQKAQARKNINAVAHGDVTWDLTIGMDVTPAGEYVYRTGLRFTRKIYDENGDPQLHTDGSPVIETYDLDDTDLYILAKMYGFDGTEPNFYEALAKNMQSLKADALEIDEDEGMLFLMSGDERISESGVPIPGGDVFVANDDTTYAEIKAAYDAGKACFANFGDSNGALLLLTGLTDDSAMFTLMTGPHLGVYRKFYSTGGEDIGLVESESVQYVEQSLSDDQKAQARTNIGALSTDDVSDVLQQAKDSGLFDGEDGYTPVKGVDYFDGKDGKDGKDGEDGEDGYTPVKGTDYFDGTDGKSAYAYAQEAGYTGTEAEFAEKLAEPAGAAADLPAVKYEAQTLTDAQKTQARTNIGAEKAGAAAALKAVSYGVQELTEEQKAQVRYNIGASDASGMYAVQYIAQELSDIQRTQARDNIGAVSYETQRYLSDEQKTQARANIGAEAAGAATEAVNSLPAVKYEAQTLTDAQKTQARTNIGAEQSGAATEAVNSLPAVKYEAQTLTDEQKTQVRTNIGAEKAGAAAALPAVKYAYQSLTPEEKAQARANIGAAAFDPGGSDQAVTYIYSTDSENPLDLWSIDPGAYILHGTFIPFEGATTEITFYMELVVITNVDVGSREFFAIRSGNLRSPFVRTGMRVLRVSKYTGEPEVTEYATEFLDVYEVVNRSVLHSEQTLTDEQKEKARSNIGAEAAGAAAEAVNNLPAVKYEAQTLTDAQKTQARTNIGAEKAGAATEAVNSLPAVKYEAQTLTDEQKAQARLNIGAEESGTAAALPAVKYEAQTLTDAQKTQARTNIGAAGEDKLPKTVSVTHDNAADAYVKISGFGTFGVTLGSMMGAFSLLLSAANSDLVLLNVSFEGSTAYPKAARLLSASNIIGNVYYSAGQSAVYVHLISNSDSAALQGVFQASVLSNIANDFVPTVSTVTASDIPSDAEDIAISDVVLSSDYERGLEIVTTGGTGAAYTATVPGIKELTSGVSFIMIPHTTSTNASVGLNANGLGEWPLVRPYANSPNFGIAGSHAAWLVAGAPYLVTFIRSASGLTGMWAVMNMPQITGQDLSGIVNIQNGGTGADTAEGARANLGLSTETWTFTLEDGSTVTKAVYVG